MRLRMNSFTERNLPERQQPQDELTLPVISVYTRAQALANGTLVDVSELAKEAGFRFPVALTCSVHAHYVWVPDGVLGQDETGRLWDILTMLSYAIRNTNTDSDTLAFQLYVRNDNEKPRLVTLKAVCGPDDDGSPCLTVMLPNED